MTEGGGLTLSVPPGQKLLVIHVTFSSTTCTWGWWVGQGPGQQLTALSPAAAQSPPALQSKKRVITVQRPKQDTPTAGSTCNHHSLTPGAPATRHLALAGSVRLGVMCLAVTP